MKVPIPLVMAKNIKENQKTKATASSIFVNKLLVISSVFGLLVACFFVVLKVTLMHKNKYAAVNIAKLDALKPDIKKKMRFNSIHTGDKYNAIMIYEFLIFLLRDIEIGRLDIIYNTMRNAINRNTVVIILPGVTEINSVGMPK